MDGTDAIRIDDLPKFRFHSVPLAIEAALVVLRNLRWFVVFETFKSLAPQLNIMSGWLPSMLKERIVWELPGQLCLVLMRKIKVVDGQYDSRLRIRRRTKSSCNCSDLVEYLSLDIRVL